MEFPEPWHRYEPRDWLRLTKAILRLNSFRRRKGLPVALFSSPPSLAPRLDGEGSEAPHAGGRQMELFPKDTGQQQASSEGTRYV